MGAERTRRARPADDPRLDHGVATPILKQSGRGKACRAAPPKPASTVGAAARETTRLLRGLKRLHQEGFGTRCTRRTNAARPDAKIVVAGHCFRENVSKAECSLSIAAKGTSPGLLAMFEGGLKLHSSLTQPTGRTLRLLSCPPRSVPPWPLMITLLRSIRKMPRRSRRMREWLRNIGRQASCPIANS